MRTVSVKAEGHGLPQAQLDLGKAVRSSTRIWIPAKMQACVLVEGHPVNLTAEVRMVGTLPEVASVSKSKSRSSVKQSAEDLRQAGMEQFLAQKLSDGIAVPINGEVLFKEYQGTGGTVPMDMFIQFATKFLSKEFDIEES